MFLFLGNYWNFEPNLNLFLDVIMEGAYLVVGNVTPKMIAKTIRMSEIVLITQQHLVNLENLFVEELAYRTHGVATGIEIARTTKMKIIVQLVLVKNGSFK